MFLLYSFLIVSISDDTINLPSGTKHVDINFPSKYISSTNIICQRCQFSAILSIQGTVLQTSGGAFYSNGFQSAFINCQFTSNMAIFAGACAILNTESTFKTCNFSKNQATEEIGAILIEKSEVNLTECILHQNSAKLSVGAIRTFTSSFKSEDTIFNNNYALSNCGALEIIDSDCNLIKNQFSNNSCLQTPNAISINAKNSNITIVSCKFNTDLQSKLHIFSNNESITIIKNSCFDASEKVVQRSIQGEYQDQNNTYEKNCSCKQVSIKSPIDITTFNIEVETQIFRTDFIVNLLVIITATAFFSYFVLKKEKKQTFFQLIN